MKAATRKLRNTNAGGGISIHAAREGGDGRVAVKPACKALFQSTPPVKAATQIFVNRFLEKFISIHAAREGGDFSRHFDSGLAAISIHAAREGGDYAVREYEHSGRISIHAAREGGDPDNAFKRQAVFISIHAAREGGDQKPIWDIGFYVGFQSTPPVKAATAETNRRNQHFRKQQV